MPFKPILYGKKCHLTFYWRSPDYTWILSLRGMKGGILRGCTGWQTHKEAR